MAVASELVLYNGCLPATPFHEYVTAAATSGFQAISIWPLVYQRAISREGHSPADMRRLLDDAGIACVEVEGCGDWALPSQSGHSASALRSRWDRTQFFAAASELGADTVSAALVGDRSATLAEATEGFGRLCGEAAQFGLRISLEFVTFGPVCDLATGCRILRDTASPNAGITIDTSHLVRGGWDERALAGIPASCVFALQLSDGPLEPPADLVEEAMYHRQLPGQGEFDVAAVVSVLERNGVRTRVGPELYRSNFKGRPAISVARELMNATRNVLSMDVQDETPRTGQ